MRMLPTDEQVIERIRRWQRYRRPVGALCFVLGLVFTATILYWIHDLRAQSLALLSQLDPSKTPTTQEMQRSFDQTQYYMGFGLGFSLATGLATGASLATSGLMCLISRGRKDHLLLRCWDGRAGAS